MFLSLHLSAFSIGRNAAGVGDSGAGCGVLIDGAPPGATVD